MIMADPSLYTPVADNSLLTYGENLIAQGDDNSEQFDITSIFENGFLFGDRTFEELFLSTNGGASFIDQSILFNGTFENTNFIIAPFFDDLDNRTLPPGATPGIYFDTNTERDSIVMTWDGVGIFSNNVTAPNTFQLEIMDLGNGDSEVIFRYFDMGNSRGNTFQAGLVADGGPRLFLRGGTNGDELGTAANIDTLVGNTGVAGVWQYRIIDGQLQINDLEGDTLVGNANPNTINGTDRNDVIGGGDGNDTIRGRLGIDQLSGDAGNDSIFGEGDDDILHGGDDNDTVNGGSGDDTVFGDAGNDSLLGESGTNELDGGAGADTLNGTGGDSFAAYGSSSTGLTVNLNNTSQNTGDAVGDTYTNITDLIGSNFNDDLIGTNQNNILRGGSGNDALTGDDGNDTLFGEDGDDILNGGDGNDELAGGAGADTLLGGPGSGDSASYRDAASAVTADLEDSSTNTGEAAGDTYSSIENLIGSDEDDILRGNSTANDISGLDGDDTLVGRAGDDDLNGNNGDDVLNGGEGADALDGGRGIDTATYVDATTGVTANLTNSASNSGEATGDTYNSIENLTGSAFNDALTGNASDNILSGLGGDDQLNGASGNDTLRGGEGADTLSGSSGTDTADYSQASAGVSASLFDSSGNTGDARGDTYNSIENLMGTEFNDTLEGDSSDNAIFGLGGDDLINSRGGTDSFDGGEGSDTVSYANANSFVTIDLEDNSANAGEASGSTFTSIEHLTGTDGSDDLLGDDQNNLLVGGGNVDNLDGRAGDDTLQGGAGNDALTGGSGADTFVVENGMGNDVISDFVLGTDSLDFSALTSAEREAVTFSGNGSGHLVVTLRDGSSVTMTGVARNAEPTGTPTITGTPTQGETLTADTTTIADLNGLGEFSYQWQRDGVNIDGATGETLELSQSDAGTVITVIVSYTDDFGTEESITSAATTAVENVNDAPTGDVTITGTATQGETLTANTDAVSDLDGINTATEAGQWMRNGVAIDGATNDTYVLTQADVGQQISAVFTYTDNFGTEETVTSAATTAVENVNDAPTGDVTITGTVRQGETLTANTDAVSDADGIDESTEAGQWMRNGVAIDGATNDTYVLTQADVGQQISAVFTYTDDFGTDESVTSAATTAVENVNDAPTGDVTITGTLSVGGTLTANTDAVSDVDGIDESTEAGQWMRSGVAIAGATNDTYVLTSADVGHEISAVFTYTDNSGTDESVTSASTAPIVGGLNLVGTPGNDRLEGGDFNDTISGLDGTDTLIGGAGNDSITGGATSADLRDNIFGGAGDDTIDGGSGNDELRGDAGNDNIAGGIGADTVIGGTGDDTLTGSSLGDEIFGSEGFDFINGGFGHDRLNGGADGDRFFHLGIADHGSDWIQDYNAADGDVLQWGGVAATAADFQINTADTANAGVAGVSESFIIYVPTEQIMWALVDGNAQTSINIQIAGQVFDLLV
jgi:Ca2+-binding RTX toxin-like protein